MVKSNVVERKVDIEGKVREYPCLWEHHSPTLAIIRYDVARGGVLADGAISIPSGTRSYGYFWRSRRYGCYRFVGPGDFGVVAHRFDALKGATWNDDVLEYRDLVLDWWVTADGALIAEDMDEFDDATSKGKLSAADIERALGAARDLSSRYRHVIDDIGILERRFVDLSD